MQTNPPRLEAVLEVEILREALRNLSPSATHVAFQQPLPADAAQALLLALLAMPEVSGPLGGDLLRQILHEEALRTLETPEKQN